MTDSSTDTPPGAGRPLHSSTSPQYPSSSAPPPLTTIRPITVTFIVTLSRQSMTRSMAQHPSATDRPGDLQAERPCWEGFWGPGDSVARVGAAHFARLLRPYRPGEDRVGTFPGRLTAI